MIINFIQIMCLGYYSLGFMVIFIEFKQFFVNIYILLLIIIYIDNLITYKCVMKITKN